MKKRILLFILFLCSISAFAQHSVTFTYNASTTVGIAGYNAYRTNCSTALVNGLCPVASEGSFIKLNSSVILGTTYVDGAVTAGSIYSYYFTAVCPATGCSTSVGGESGPSVHIGAAIPKDTPLPPTTITLSQISMTTVQGQSTVAATWASPDISKSTSYRLVGWKGDLLAQGTRSTTDGTYQMSWTGKKQQSATFTACDTAGCVTAVVR